MTTPEKIRAERYANLGIPPLVLDFDVQISKDTQLKMRIIGQFSPGTAIRLKTLCDHILSVVEDFEHAPLDDEPASPPQSNI